MSTSNTNAIRMELEHAISGMNASASAQTEINQARVGHYDLMVRAGIRAASEKVLDAECQKVMQAVREDRNGLAEALGCKPAKDSVDTDGNPVRRFKVPSSFSSAKSWILAALRYGVDLGSLKKPKAFRDIRTEVAYIRSAEERQSTDPETQDRFRVKDAMEAIQKAVNAKGEQALSPNAVYELANALEQVVHQLGTAPEKAPTGDFEELETGQTTVPEAPKKKASKKQQA